MKESLNQFPATPAWHALLRPGWCGTGREEREKGWDEVYGEGNWKIAWRMANGEVWDFLDVFWREYVGSYAQYFTRYPEELSVLSRYAYTYAKNPADRGRAFDPLAAYGKNGAQNQFHHVAINYAVGLAGGSFRGSEPLKIGGCVSGTSQEDWLVGEKLSPGMMPSLRPELIPNVTMGDCWWQPGSIECFYQSTKTLFVRTSLVTAQLADSFHQA